MHDCHRELGGLALEAVRPADGCGAMDGKTQSERPSGKTVAQVQPLLLRSAMKRAVGERLFEWNPADLFASPKVAVQRFTDPPRTTRASSHGRRAGPR